MRREYSSLQSFFEEAPALEYASYSWQDVIGFAKTDHSWSPMQ